MKEFLIGFLVLILLLIESSSYYSYKYIKKYLLNNNIKPMGFKMGISYKFMDVIFFFQIYNQNLTHSKQEKELYLITIIQVLSKLILVCTLVLVFYYFIIKQ